MKIPKIKYPLVLVHWIDIISDTGWGTPKDVKGMLPGNVIEVGWMIHEDKDNIILMSQSIDNEFIGNRTCIPRGVIKSIKKIRG